MELEKIFIDIPIEKIHGSFDCSVSHMTLDSRDVRGDSIFVAIKGDKSDGHVFIDSAIQSGALMIICSVMPEKIHENITYVCISNIERFIGVIASRFYGHPSETLKVIGVTGTNGKTTIATLLYKAMGHLGKKAGLISTIENYVCEKVLQTSNTTPNAITIQRLFREMINAGCEYCFMEVSSHALVLGRVNGIKFYGGIFTNLTLDHLDFHKTLSNYLEAKKLFFDMLPQGAFALVNIDDEASTKLTRDTKATISTYALLKDAFYKGEIKELVFPKMAFEINGLQGNFKLVGDYNAYNILAIYGTLQILGFEPNKSIQIIERLDGARGRFEILVSKLGGIAIIDYAHTPDGLQNVLKTISNINQNKHSIITVFGCGGDRDRSKRPLMTEIALRYSNKVIVTTDNSRSENPENIIADMVVTLTGKTNIEIILDRSLAIATAVKSLQSGDIVLIAGKGHEMYQDIKGVKTHFSDREEVEKNFTL